MLHQMNLDGKKWFEEIKTENISEIGGGNDTQKSKSSILFSKATAFKR